MSLFAKIRWALACGLVCGVVLFQSGDVLTYWRGSRIDGQLTPFRFIWSCRLGRPGMAPRRMR